MQNYTNVPYLSFAQPYTMRQNQYMMPQTIPGMMPQQYGMPQASTDAGDLATYTYPQNVPEALKLIQEAVAGEAEDRLFYQYLIENALSEEDKEIITGIRDDEISHLKGLSAENRML